MSELDTTQNTSLIPAQSLPVYTGRTFAEMMREADVSEGGDLLDSKADLVGIPFLIYRATFRDGIIEKDGTIRNYVSLDIITGDAEMYQKRAAFMPESPKFGPGETLVFNDGSTGVLRQITEYLHEKGLINVGEVYFTGGGMGESSYDRYRRSWVSPKLTPTADGKYPDVAVDCRLFLKRGLRVSEYDYNNQAAATYYFG